LRQQRLPANDHEQEQTRQRVSIEQPCASAQIIFE
jgi:hypothetical protein